LAETPAADTWQKPLNSSKHIHYTNR
jgi:hypothetical protein